MEWFVRHRKSGADQLVWQATPEHAIETACQLLDEGHDVFAIGTGSLADSIETDQIALIYDIWVRARPVSSVPHPERNDA
jgi:hypothetical protein